MYVHLLTYVPAKLPKAVTVHLQYFSIVLRGERIRADHERATAWLYWSRSTELAEWHDSQDVERQVGDKQQPGLTM